MQHQVEGVRLLLINGVTATFHHMGIPTTEKKPRERYSERFGMHTSDSNCKTMRIQWHRFEPNSPIHPLIQTIPHVAFRVDDLKSAIAGYNLLLEPYEPISGYKVAIIEDAGQPIELVETTLTEEQLWKRAEMDSILYTAEP
jgi:hypothetical protein